MSVSIESQKMLIQHLQDALNSVQRSQPPPPPVQFRTGLRSISDHIILMKHYTCICGQKMNISSHQTINRYDGIYSDDIYSMNCECGAREKISFQMMTRFLKEDKGVFAKSSVRSLGYL